MKLRHFTTNKFLKEFASDDIEQAWEDAEYNYEQDTGKNWDDASRITQENYYAKALLNYGFKITANGIVRMESTESTNESLQALARHVKEGVPLVDSLFRYQSEAYFDTFKKAKQLREAGSLPELDWESEEMLGTDIGESVVLENGERVWLDVPYLNEDDDFVYASEIVYFDKDGKEIGYLDWDGYTDANTNHSEEELQAIAQKFNISPEKGKVVGYWDGSNDEIDFSGPSDETYPDGTTGVYIDRHSKEESIKEAEFSDLQQAYDKVYQLTDKMGDEALEQMNRYAPKFSDALEKHEDIETIEKREPQNVDFYIRELEDAEFQIGESVNEAEEGMIGEPDNYYNAEERKEAYDDLQTALDGVRNDWEKQSVIDGICPECSGTSYMDGDYDNDEDSCYGWGNYGCDGGEMENASWVEIIKFDQQNVDRQKAKDNYPGDEEVIKGLANMMKNMDDPRQAYQQMQADYPHMGRAQRSSLIAKAKQIAFPESIEIDKIKQLAGLNELKDERTDIQKIEDLLKDAIGPDNSGGDMYELYAELESINSEQADEIKLIAKEMYGVKLEEGKSPHKKGTKKYKKHMAAMHAEAVRGRPKIDGEATEIQKIKIGGVEREFIRKGEMWHSTDPMYPMTYGYNTPTGQKIAKGRANALAKTTPSYQAKLKKNKVMASEAEYQGKDVELNKPKRGGSKKYYVYVKNPKTGNVKKISFGDPGLKTKSGNKDRAKSFAARHNCEKKNDKTKAGYWACRLPRYGLVKGGKWW